MHVELTPAGARSLLGAPAAAVAGTVVDLDRLLGGCAGELVERLAAAPGWADRFAILDQILCRRLNLLRPAPEYLAHAWDRIIGSAGTVRIAEVAADTGFSARYLRRRFAAEYGLTPKDVARIARFERSRWLLQHPARPCLAAIAARCGYYDQAHLARDWNDLAGCPPSAWLAADTLPLTEITHTPPATP